MQEIQDYIQEKKNIYDNLIKILESVDNNEDDIQNLINLISEQKQEESTEKLKKILQLLASISNNYHHSESLFNKIFHIIEKCEDQIKQTMRNIEIFNIFESNKKLLLFLFKKRIIIIDDTISNELLSKVEPNGNRYCHFFYPEIKNFVCEEKIKLIEKELLENNSNVFDRFEEKREEGENDTFICSLIRKDSIEDFISYVNRTNLSLNNEIKHSIFETNSFLNENKNISLIEYACFFGSIQIFQYLIMNKIELKPSLWLYSIHSRNAQMIDILESKKIEPPKFLNNNNNKKEENDSNKNKSYLRCFCESIKCHHNEFANYIENNFLIDENIEIFKNEKVLSNIIQYHNYEYFPSDIENEEEFYYLCTYNYHKLVNLLIKMKEESIKKEISEKIYNL